MENSYIISPKNLNKFYHKTIAVSHGSSGITSSEIKICDFFLEKGFEVQLYDHFTTLGIEKLNWGYTTGYIDNYNITLLELINTIPSDECISKNHLGMSLGGYIGINNLNFFKNVFCCYPGNLPILEEQFLANTKKIHIFEAENDSWTKLPNEIKNHIKPCQYHLLKNAYHSFMSLNKDKLCQVNTYNFQDSLVAKDIISNLKLNHQSLTLNSKSKEILSRNKSDKFSYKFVLEQIIKEINRDR